MAITPLPPAPLPTDTPTEFNAKAFDLVAALEDFVTETNALAVAVDADASAADADAATATTKASEASASATLASNWATKTDAYVSGSDNSSKSWAVGGTSNGNPSGGSAKDWATKTDGAVAGGEFSAKKYATDAASYASAALTSANNAAASYDSFDDRYLGAKGSDPSVDNDGNALLTGALYWNTGANEMRAYSGSAWVATYLPAGSYLTSSDIGVSVQAYDSTILKSSNIGVTVQAYDSTILKSSNIGVTVQAYDSDLTTWGGKTAPSGTVVGTTDTQTLSAKTITGIKQTKVAMAANDISLTAGNYFTKTISTTTTLTVSNVPTTGTAASFILDLTNGGAGTITWWSGMKWAGGTAPTLTASGRDVLGFFTHDGGTTWSGFVLGKDVK